jgi:hypothetical protein
MTKGYDIITPWRPWFLANPPQTEAHPMKYTHGWLAEKPSDITMFKNGKSSSL